MIVCRLCSGTKEVVDLFHTHLANAGQIRFYILLATGIYIQETDRISRMVCRQCCEIVIKFHRYRCCAIDNDKKLQEQIGQRYIPPIIDHQEIRRLAIDLLKGNISAATIDNILRAVSLSSQQSNNVQMDNFLRLPEQKVISKKHISVEKLVSECPSLLLPQRVHHSNIAPVVTIDPDEIDEWHKSMFKSLEQRLLSSSIHIRKVVKEDPESTTIDHQEYDPQSKIISTQVADVCPVMLYKPGPKSMKEKLLIKPTINSVNETITTDIKDTETITTTEIKDNPNLVDKPSEKSLTQVKRTLLDVTETNTNLKRLKLMCGNLQASCEATSQLQESMEQSPPALSSSTTPAISPPNISRTGTFKLFLCKSCNIGFKNKFELQKHSVSVHQQVLNDELTDEFQQLYTVKILETSKLQANAVENKANIINNIESVIDLSDSDDELTTLQFNINALKKLGNEQDIISSLFDKHNTIKKDSRVTQTFLPGNRTVSFIHPNKGIILKDMHKEMLKYKIPVEFETKSSIQAYFKYEHKVKQSKVLMDWSHIKLITLNVRKHNAVKMYIPIKNINAPTVVQVPTNKYVKNISRPANTYAKKPQTNGNSLNQTVSIGKIVSLSSQPSKSVPTPNNDIQKLTSAKVVHTNSILPTKSNSVHPSKTFVKIITPGYQTILNGNRRITNKTTLQTNTPSQSRNSASLKPNETITKPGGIAKPSGSPKAQDSTRPVIRMKPPWQLYNVNKDGDITKVRTPHP